MRIRIRGGRALIGGRLVESDLSSELQSGLGALDHSAERAPSDITIDATGLLVLPGMVDIHGDAFERQIEPRPGVSFDIGGALVETDRQLISNGITTAYHGVTWSWEPGLRGSANALAVLEAIERLQSRLACDTRYHLRHETFNLAAEPTIAGWLAGRRLGCLAFNDHMSATIKERERPAKIARMVERSGLSAVEFNALVDRTYARRDEVPASIARLAAQTVAAGVPILSHDDATTEQRAWYHRLGAAICEFPMTEAVARAALQAGSATVFGAPNVVRGGSHTGCPTAADMVAAGLCSILASDYYYPALLQAPFRIAASGVWSLARAWRLVSANPALALGLHDRGELAPGKRADIVLVDAVQPVDPAVVATIANGRLRYIADGDRIARQRAARPAMSRTTA